MICIGNKNKHCYPSPVQHVRITYYYLGIENAEGNVLIAVYLYACVLFACQKVLNRIAWNLVG